MADRAAEASRCIYEQREENMVSSKDGKQTRRVARFLKPRAANITSAVAPPHAPLLYEAIPHNLQQWPSKVFFKGWKIPQRKWDEWVDRLAGKYCFIWNQSGICDAILSSRYEVRCNNKDIVLGLVEFWCSETNTFVFPWGEATVTLEDVMILGGFSVLGRPVTRPVDGSLVEIVDEMEKKRVEITRTKSKKACQFSWIKHFMELQNDYEYEHVAFLSLWLSRFVFPSLPDDTVGRHVFPIAAHLSQGKRLALAPAVLSGLYKDLSFLKKQALSCVNEISVYAPFQLLQLWALERFQPLVQTPPKVLKPGEPRAGRWHKVNSKSISLPLVRTVYKLQENFQWRPYAADYRNWSHSSYYKESKGLCLRITKHTDEDLQSYVKCLCTSELVGVEQHCKEKYLPHRVAMQFGMDQDLPGEFSALDFASGTNVGFLIPPWSFQPSVSARYLDWWKESNSARAEAIKKDVIVATQNIKKKCNASIVEKNLQMQKESAQTLTKSKREQKSSHAMPEKSNSSVNKEASATPEFSKAKKVSPPENSDDGDDIPLSARIRCFGNRPACLPTASPTRGSTKFVFSTSYIQDVNVKKQKLATTTKGFPAKKRNAGDFSESVTSIAKKGRNCSDAENVQVGVSFTKEQKHNMGAKVSEKVDATEGKKATAEGYVKNSIGVDDHEWKQCEKGAVKLEVKKPMHEGFQKNPVSVGVGDRMENTTDQTQKVGLLTRVENLEKVLLG